MKASLNHNVGVIIPTYNGRKHMQFCLPPLMKSPLKPRVLVVDSSSTDGTAMEAGRLGAETLVIPHSAFNHGTTRERARKLMGGDIVVMMTQDAYPADKFMLEKLIAPLVAGKAAASYARQIPHNQADIFESFPRTFNYPAISHIRGLEDCWTYGVYAFFCSNSCAAYLNVALDHIGGFKSTLTNEDYFAAAELILAGYKIAYSAEAIVQHSHRYTLIQEFQRYFDTGYVRAERPWIQERIGHPEKRGKDFFIAFLKAVYLHQPHMLGYALMQLMAKWMGYRLGYLSTRAPIWLKSNLSSQYYYWNSKDIVNIVPQKIATIFSEPAKCSVHNQKAT